MDKEGVRPGAGGVGGLLMVVDNVTNKTYLAMNDYIGNVIGLVDPTPAALLPNTSMIPSGAPSAPLAPTPRKIPSASQASTLVAKPV